MKGKQLTGEKRPLQSLFLTKALIVKMEKELFQFNKMKNYSPFDIKRWEEPVFKEKNRMPQMANNWQNANQNNSDSQTGKDDQKESYGCWRGYQRTGTFIYLVELWITGAVLLESNLEPGPQNDWIVDTL